MRIAIVDDNTPERNELRDRLELQLSRRALYADILEYESGESFLTAAAQEPFSLVFLDIYMDGMNGVETAVKLRTFDRDCILVFTTTSMDHALDAFRVRALQYLVKPYADQQLSDLLQEVTGRLPDPEPDLRVRTTDGAVPLRFSDILYAGHFQHQIYIHTTDGRSTITRQTFKEFFASLNDDRFFLCSRGMVVNLEHAADLDGTDFVLENGVRIPVARSLVKDARTAFGDFLFKRGRKK